MQLSRAFHPFDGSFEESNDISGDGFLGGPPDSYPFGFGLPNMHRFMQVYVVPPEHEHSPWKIAAMAMLLISVAFAGLIVFYCCVVRCCCRKKKTDAEDEENPENGERPEPFDLAATGAVDSKQTDVPASFLESPTLNVSQPYQPEPEDLAKMQEVMLAKLESTNDDWDMGHGDLDKKPLY